VWKQRVDASGSESARIILIGTKSDLLDGRVVSYERAKALADSWHCQYAEVSALDPASINNALVPFAFEIIRYFDLTNSKSGREASGQRVITLNRQNPQSQEGFICCT
jgi:Ras-related protein Rab-1A